MLRGAFIAGVFLSFPFLGHAQMFEGISCDAPLTVDEFERVRCCFREPQYAAQCLDGVLPPLVRDEGLVPVLGALERTRMANPAVDQTCHQIVHAVGREAYRELGFAKAFEQCDDTCQSGCYHGVIERVFSGSDEGADSHPTYAQIKPRIPGICTPQNLGTARPELLMQCQHGLGHALLYTLDYDLSRALEGCDVLRAGRPRQACYLGVFMENTNAPEAAKRDIRAERPLYPCDDVAERHKPACYNNQTKAWIQLGYGSGTIVGLCSSLPSHRYNCFVGIGRDWSPLVRQGKPTELAALCESAGEHETGCVEGAVHALVDFTSRPQEAHQFCETVTDPAGCFTLTNRYLRSMYGKTTQEIHAACGPSETCLAHDAEPRMDPLGKILYGLWSVFSKLWN